MLNFYLLADRQLTETSPAAAASLILTANPTAAEQKVLCQTFDLEPLTFAFCNAPEEVSRFHALNSTVLVDDTLLVLYDFIDRHETIERQLAPVIIIFDRSHLLLCTENAQTYRQELEKVVTTTTAVYDLVFHCIKHCQDNLLAALLSYKPEIDRLDAAARQTIENDELQALTNLTRKLVFFEHTMNDQSETLTSFLATP